MKCTFLLSVPEEFLYDPTTRSYGDPARRPEIKNATIEFIAPSDYMVWKQMIFHKDFEASKISF